MATSHPVTNWMTVSPLGREEAWSSVSQGPVLRGIVIKMIRVFEKDDKTRWGGMLRAGEGRGYLREQ